ncbi:MAG: tyrosine-type recombinase/integrase [Candidatus Kryptoniota bacterium]
MEQTACCKANILFRSRTPSHHGRGESRIVRNYGKPVDKSTANDKFKEYCKRASLDPQFHFHTLRHTFASHLALKGGSLYFIQKIMGHQSIQTTTRIYAHLQPEPLLGAVKVLQN